MAQRQTNDDPAKGRIAEPHGVLRLDRAGAARRTRFLPKGKPAKRRRHVQLPGACGGRFVAACGRLRGTRGQRQRGTPGHIARWLAGAPGAQHDGTVRCMASRQVALGRTGSGGHDRSESPTMSPTLGAADRPVLYSFRRCPYAIRARLAIRVSGSVVALREVVLRDKPAELVTASPRATVPVLQLADGTVLAESLDIMRWALGANDPQGWLRADEHQAVTDLTAVNDGIFKQALDRYKYAPQHDKALADARRDEAVALMLQPLESRLAQHACLLRDTPSLADMAIVPFVRQFAAVDAGWFERAPLPHLRAWLHRLTGSALFTSVMPKFPPWRRGAVEVLF
jgi:glutathione S-transferase